MKEPNYETLRELLCEIIDQVDEMPGLPKYWCMNMQTMLSKALPIELFENERNEDERWQCGKCEKELGESLGNDMGEPLPAHSRNCDKYVPQPERNEDEHNLDYCTGDCNGECTIEDYLDIDNEGRLEVPRVEHDVPLCRQKCGEAFTGFSSCRCKCHKRPPHTTDCENGCNKNCKCACHENKLGLDQGYAHDTKCCDKMFGGIIPDSSKQDTVQEIIERLLNIRRMWDNDPELKDLEEAITLVRSL